MTDAEALRAHAEQIRSCGVLGRSPLMQRLFEFLLECSLAGKAPKEIEVAVDAFGKGADFDVTQDAMVRVYIHKLRRKLEEFYSGPGGREPVRLTIPKGEYRFVVEQVSPASGEAEIPGIAPPEREIVARRKWLLPALAISLVVNALILVAVLFWPKGTDDGFAPVRESAVWRPLLEDDRRIYVVVGDYYIFGEIDETMEVKRLVREFDINSKQELDSHLQQNPELAERYIDLDLAYLPTASAFALREVMPVLAPAHKRVRVVTMSQLDPEVLKSANVVYVGFLSGLGMLSDIVFAGSRLEVGESFDEIVDRDTRQRYISQAAGAPIRGDRKFHDYGYFATFAGPSGNRIVVIAGTRDVAAMHMAETVTDAGTLASLITQAGNTRGFEALYEVYGMDRLNLDGRLLLTSPVDSARIWTGEPRGHQASVPTHSANATSR